MQPVLDQSDLAPPEWQMISATTRTIIAEAKENVKAADLLLIGEILELLCRKSITAKPQVGNQCRQLRICLSYSTLLPLISIDQLSIPDWWQNACLAPTIADGLVRQLAKCSYFPTAVLARATPAMSAAPDSP